MAARAERWATGKGLVALLNTLSPEYDALLKGAALAPADLSIREVEKSYRKATLLLHPDRNNAQEAEEVLKVITRAHADTAKWFHGLLDHMGTSEFVAAAAGCVNKKQPARAPSKPARAYTTGMDGSDLDDEEFFSAPPVRSAKSAAPVAADDVEEEEDDEPAADVSDAAPPVPPTPPTSAADAPHGEVAYLRERVSELEAELRHERDERMRMEEQLSDAYGSLIRELIEGAAHTERELRRARAAAERPATVTAVENMAYAIHKAVKETEGEADEDEEAETAPPSPARRAAPAASRHATWAGMD